MKFEKSRYKKNGKNAYCRFEEIDHFVELSIMNAFGGQNQSRSVGVEKSISIVQLWVSLFESVCLFFKKEIDNWNLYIYIYLSIYL